MPYEVLKDEVGVLRALSKYTNDAGEVLGYDHESIIYYQGEIIADEDVSPVVVKLYDEDDEHVRSCLKRVREKAEPTPKKKAPVKRTARKTEVVELEAKETE